MIYVHGNKGGGGRVTSWSVRSAWFLSDACKKGEEQGMEKMLKKAAQPGLSLKDPSNFQEIWSTLVRDSDIFKGHGIYPSEILKIIPKRYINILNQHMNTDFSWLTTL